MPARRRRRAAAPTAPAPAADTQAHASGGRGNAARLGAGRAPTGGFSLGGDLGSMAGAMGIGGELLERGDRGPSVKALQAALGMPAEQQDGDFGPITRAAVVAFQRRSGLAPDGIVGPDTQAALQRSSAPAPTEAAPAAVAPAPVVEAPEADTPAEDDAPSDRDAAIAAATTLRDATTDGKLVRSGASGPEVLEIQKLLGVGTTGEYGRTTQDAVKAFQRENNLSADGVVGPDTMAALLRGGAAREIDNGVIFEEGSVGPGVLALQKALGMGTGGQTGEFGPTTAQAVREFQAKNDIEQTGKVGPTTWAALKSPAFDGAPGAAGGYDKAIGEALARTSVRVNGGNRRSMSLCYKYVADAVDIVIGRFLYGGHAYMAASQFAAKKDLFTEISPSSLGSLPAGAIVVWGKGNSRSGHISIALGDGRESSDHVAPQMMSHYGGAGARVFLPKGRS